MRKIRFIPLVFATLTTISATGQNFLPLPTDTTRSALSEQEARSLSQIRIAYDAYQAKQSGQLAEMAAQMSQSLLAAYPVYWQIQLGLKDPPASMNKGSHTGRPEAGSETIQVISRFISSYPDSYLSNRLLSDWLRQYGRRGDWATIRRHFPQVVEPDVELTCYGWQAMLAEGNTVFSSEAEVLWARSLRTPAACQPIFNNLVERRVVSARSVIERIYLLWRLKYDTAARALAERLSADSGVLPGDYDRAAKSPTITACNGAETKMARLFALLRLSRTDPGQAVSAWQAIDGKTLYSPAEQALFWNLIGFEAANRLMSEADDWFANAPETDSYRPKINELGAWKARAGIRAGRWSLVLKAISEMNGPMAALPDWIFWRAKALSMMGYTDEARTLWSSIANRPVYYGVLAAEQLGQPIVLPPANQATEVDRRAVWTIGAMQRAILLFSAGLRNEALGEWFWAIRGMNDQQLLATAEIAFQRGIYDRAISAADQTKNDHNFYYRYPLPHREIIRRNAAMVNLDESWVYGLIRQESRFVNVARSSAGASGLKQLMPATARWTAKHIRMTDFSPAQVNDIEINVRLGTAYLDYALNRFDRQLPMGVAAYNAGPGRPSQWRAATALEGPAYIESIPFDETRDYVKKVLANIYLYEMVMGKAPVPLTATSSTIAGR